MTIVQGVFILMALITLIGGIGVVLARSVFVGALFLILSFVGVAGIYVVAEAGFLAGVQLLIYVGAIAVLILFTVMLTRNVMSEETRPFNEQWGIAGTIAGFLFVVLALIGVSTNWQISTASPPADSVTELAKALLGPYGLPFEVASVVLLVALVGAIMIARD